MTGIITTLAPQDTDGDGIADAVDTLIAAFSNDFSDVGLGGATTGTITTRGDQILTVREEQAPDGVRVKADPSGGPTPAILSACGGISLSSLSPGDELIITCGSVTLRVISGIVEITFVAADGTTATTSLDAGNSITFEPITFIFTASSANTDTIVILVEGNELFIAPGQTAKAVGIDIKPGSDPNSISLSDQGLLPVAVFGSSIFDVTTIDPSTIELGGVQIATRGSAKAPKLAFSFEDVNLDGRLDMMCFFSVQDLVNAGALTSTTDSLALTANLFNGTPILGTDSVNAVP